jgi:hypothetical protein
VLQAIGARYEPIDDIVMNGFQYRILAPRADYGAGCDEARFYGLVSKLKSITPRKFTVSVTDRNTRPQDWTGPAGVSEVLFLNDQKAGTLTWANYRLWIAPLDWQGTNPSGGGATYLGRNTCFQFYGYAFDIDPVWPTARADIGETLGIMPSSQ